ncbi:glycoside hydrolase family 26 protein [uncultured Cellulomonas sp.]|uniref:glycoside hydrolase family 26 protein n=1 Tax=uncultured Cellulomonas sp. TaxID=189682 RepID=UPI0026155F86|nr:glycosyl hydrolase [uncultured Cellulomonas sp.]
MRRARMIGAALLLPALLSQAGTTHAATAPVTSRAVVADGPLPAATGSAVAGGAAPAVTSHSQHAAVVAVAWPGEVTMTARTTASTPSGQGKGGGGGKGGTTAPAEPVPVPVAPLPLPGEPAPPAPVPEPPTGSTTPAPAADDVARRTVPLGVTVPWGPLDAQALAATAATVGVGPSYLQWYTGWGEAPDVAKLQAVVDAGAVPVVTWEPWVWTDGVTQPRFAMSTVVAGDHDAYLTAWADALAAWGGPVMLRFAHEANGDWYPWSAGVNGTTAADHVAAWRHVHDLFAARGAHAVQWVWAPNVVYPGSTPLTALYPGGDYVDVVGVDGYNWGTSVAWERWRTPAEVFDPTLAELRALAPGKPLLVTETASTELGGDKAAWVAALGTWAAAQPDLGGVIWFDENKETDWRLSSSPTSAAAFRAAFAPER